MQNIHFWNGNKSAVRQAYEAQLLKKCLHATSQEYGLAELHIDATDYPSADDEGNIFEAGADIIVTVAGNTKFTGKNKIMLTQPLTKGLLGYRLLVVRNASLNVFKQLNSGTDLQALTIGIPNTWADANLFRHNQYRVVEQGSLDDLFGSLKDGVFDYVALGANEIEDIFQDQTQSVHGLSIEPSLLLYYPFPLVFYIHPNQPLLAKRVEQGLQTIIENGEYDRFFYAEYGALLQRLNLKTRKIFTLTNPILPIDMQAFSATLLD